MANEDILKIAIESLPESSISVVQLLSAFLTPTLALVGIFIAIQQWRINRERFRHETYERRLSIFRTTHIYLSEVARNGGLDYEDGMKFRYDTSEVMFLFDENVVKHLDEVFHKTMDLSILKEELFSDKSCDLSDEEYRIKDSEMKDLQRWVFNQASDSRELFKKYLKINVT